ncbi:hypothetical protein BAUCODRAFT_72151, partial [Baudoinia panamericana UAMH 10762]
NMACAICLRNFNSKHEPVCAGCAQATLYGSRIQQASTLLDRERHHTQAEAIVRPGNDGVLAALPTDQLAVEGRIQRITEKAGELRRQIEEYKQYITHRREQLEHRRSDVLEERHELERQRPRAFAPIEAAVAKSRQKVHKVYQRTIDARVLLCREAALLSGLDRRRGKDGKHRYWLGDLPMLDLRDMQGKDLTNATPPGNDNDSHLQPHEVISANMDDICRLLGICCHYLSVRLPAQIILPHDDFPHAVIVPWQSAYKLKDPKYPKSSATPSSSAMLVPGQVRPKRDPPRPRPLYLDRPLAQLFKQDHKTFLLFLEGVALLAYNVAWLCRSQGVESINSFDDACAVGRNLYRLVLHEQRPPNSRKVSTLSKDERPGSASAEVRLGAYSHASADLSLTGHEGLALFKDWRMPLPNRLADILRSHLVSEIRGAEWDVLSDKEWDDEREDEVPVLVGGARRSLDHAGVAMSVMSVAPHEAQADGKQGVKGQSGWTKVRGRSGDG